MQTTRDIQASESYKNHLLKLRNASKNKVVPFVTIGNTPKVKSEPGSENLKTEPGASGWPDSKKTEVIAVRIKQEAVLEEKPKPQQQAVQPRSNDFKDKPTQASPFSEKPWSSYHHAFVATKHSAPPRHALLATPAQRPAHRQQSDPVPRWQKSSSTPCPGLLRPARLPDARSSGWQHSRPQRPLLSHPSPGPRMTPKTNAGHIGPQRLSTQPQARLHMPHHSLAFSQTKPMRMSSPKPPPVVQKVTTSDQPRILPTGQQGGQSKIKVEPGENLDKVATSAYLEHIAKLKACKMSPKNSVKTSLGNSLSTSVTSSESKNAVTITKSTPDADEKQTPEIPTCKTSVSEPDTKHQNLKQGPLSASKPVKPSLVQTRQLKIKPTVDLQQTRSRNTTRTVATTAGATNENTVASGKYPIHSRTNASAESEITVSSTNKTPTTCIKPSQDLVVEPLEKACTLTGGTVTRDKDTVSLVDSGPTYIDSTGSCPGDHTFDDGVQEDEQTDSPPCDFMDGFITLDSTYEAPDQAQGSGEGDQTHTIVRRKASDFFETPDVQNNSGSLDRPCKSVLKNNSRPKKRHLSGDREDVYGTHEERSSGEPIVKRGHGEKTGDREDMYGKHEERSSGKPIVKHGHGEKTEKYSRAASGMRFKPEIPSSERNALKVCLPRPIYSKRDVIAQMSLDSATAAGLEHLHPVSGYQCVLCQTFYLDYPTALHHCTLLSHKMKVMKEICESERERREDLDRKVKMVLSEDDDMRAWPPDG